MELAIAILVSLVISLGISIYFYKINLENNKSTQVKRLADKKIDDINENYSKIVNQYNLLVSDFKAQQSQANSAIRVFTSQNEEFKEKIKTLENSLKAIETIEAKINGYSSVLNDLNEMTEQVEENLSRIQKEHGLIKKTTQELAKQQQSVEAISKAIPKISQDFAKKNEEQLNSIGTSLLDSFKNSVLKLETETKEAQQTAEHVLLTIKQSIQNAYTEAANKAKSLEDMAFNHLSEQANLRSKK